MYKVIADLIRNDYKTIYRWKKENRPIISLLEKYFDKTELEEFLETEKIEKLELIKNYSVEELKKKLNAQQFIYDDDYIIRNLTFKFLMFNNKEALISLRKILDDLPTFNVNKSDLLKIMHDYPVKLFINTKNAKKTAIFFIDKLLTDYEVKLLIKYKKEIFTSFYDIRDTKID